MRVEKRLFYSLRALPPGLPHLATQESEKLSVLFVCLFLERCFLFISFAYPGASFEIQIDLELTEIWVPLPHEFWD